MQIFTKIINFVREQYEPVIHNNMRTGSKVAVHWLVFSGIMIVWLLVGIPWLSIFYPQLTEFAPHLSNIIIALIGGAATTYSTSEIRKTVENIKHIKRDNESPTSPFTQA